MGSDGVCVCACVCVHWATSMQPASMSEILIDVRILFVAGVDTLLSCLHRVRGLADFFCWFTRLFAKLSVGWVVGILADASGLLCHTLVCTCGGCYA